MCNHVGIGQELKRPFYQNYKKKTHTLLFTQNTMQIVIVSCVLVWRYRP